MMIHIRSFLVRTLVLGAVLAVSPLSIAAETSGNKTTRKLPRLVDSSKLESPRRANARGNALAAGFPAHRAV